LSFYGYFLSAFCPASLFFVRQHGKGGKGFIRVTALFPVLQRCALILRGVLQEEIHRVLSRKLIRSFNSVATKAPLPLGLILKVCRLVNISFVSTFRQG